MAVSAAASTLTNLAKAYKDLFPQKRLDQLANTDKPLLKWLPKKDDLVGDGLHVPIRYGKPQGKSATFTNAQAQVSSGKVKRVELIRKRYYGIVALDDEAIEAARDRMGAFYSVKEAEIEDMVTEVSETLQMHLWRDGWGILGRRASESSDVTTLTNPEDVINFRIGMTVGASSATNGSAARSGTTTITSIDYDAGTVGLDTSAITSYADNDYLFNAGDYDASSTNVGDGNLVTGLAGWIPQTAETSGTFLGMDRTDDPVRLQGHRQAWLGSIEETIKKQNSLMRRLRGKPDSVWLAPANWHRLELELGARAVREDGSAATFGLPSLKYNTPNGIMNVMADPYCPEDVGYQLKRSTWTLHHLKGLPHIVMTDGLRALRNADFDGITVRVRFWCELACDAPVHNGRFAIS